MQRKGKSSQQGDERVAKQGKRKGCQDVRKVRGSNSWPYGQYKTASTRQ